MVWPERTKRRPEVTKMAFDAGRPEIGILLYPGVQMAAVLGLTDLFALSGGTASARLSVSHWQPMSSDNRDVHRVWSSVDASGREPDVMIVPPTLNDLPPASMRAGLAHWLGAHHARGGVIVSLCSGVLLVAETGLLDGHRVSTHWSCSRRLTTSFPRVAVGAESRIVELPGIVTAGGFMAWLDVGLLLIERYLGCSARAETAQFVMPIGPAAADRPIGRQTHSDAAVRRAQDLVHLRDGRDCAVATLAAAARLERRTFLRRFTAATGMTPMEYCRAVRLARGRELLEESQLSVQEIADMVGYLDTTSFARAFRRAHGQSPAAFRRGLSVSTP